MSAPGYGRAAISSGAPDYGRRAISSGAPDYGRDGVAGIGTPQANPTVEAEMAILLPPTVTRMVSRLTSDSDEPATRLREYLVHMDRALATYDTLKPDVFGFACTASTYLVPDGQERELVSALEARFGYPVLTAAAALRAALEAIGARRIALVSPYPPAMAEAAARWWTANGYAIAAIDRIEIGGADTRGIYRLSSRDAHGAVDRLGAISVDAVVMTGTGMPSLALLADPPAGAPPLIGSNMSLAQMIAARLGIELGDWRARLSAAQGEAEAR